MQACLAIDLVVAWRVYWFTMVGREKPETPCNQILSEDEMACIACLGNRQGNGNSSLRENSDALDWQTGRVVEQREK